MHFLNTGHHIIQKGINKKNNSYNLLKREMCQAIEEVFENLDLDYQKWILALSGGVDSRANLLMLKNIKDLRCVTWGRKSSQVDQLTDAYIAKQLAAHFEIEHQFMHIDAKNVSFESFNELGCS